MAENGLSHETGVMVCDCIWLYRKPCRKPGIKKVRKKERKKGRKEERKKERKEGRKKTKKKGASECYYPSKITE